jgi:hypothetical protein
MAYLDKFISENCIRILGGLITCAGLLGLLMSFSGLYVLTET